jgi:hypothetical protein
VGFENTPIPAILKRQRLPADKSYPFIKNVTFELNLQENPHTTVLTNSHNFIKRLALAVWVSFVG